MSSDFTFQPILIIGAARSGTNILREMLTTLPGVCSWPCDEINYIWRHGNARVPHDQFSASDATPDVVEFIRGEFRRMAERTRCRWLVEKTCANSLRLEFVDAIVPAAKYLFIVRDGRDVICSAMKRWKAPLDLQYILAKARFVPREDLPYYAGRYLANRIRRLRSRDRRLATWGPRFVGMQEMLAERPLDEVCAAQWQRSVEATAIALKRIAPGRVHRLHYEEMTREPATVIEGVLRFLDVPASPAQRTKIVESVFASSVGAWRRQMSPQQRERLETMIGRTLEAFGYQTGTGGTLPRGGIEQEARNVSA